MKVGVPAYILTTGPTQTVRIPLTGRLVDFVRSSRRITDWKRLEQRRVHDSPSSSSISLFFLPLLNFAAGPETQHHFVKKSNTGRRKRKRRRRRAVTHRLSQAEGVTQAG